jgi:hypothetical protein
MMCLSSDNNITSTVLQLFGVQSSQASGYPQRFPLNFSPISLFWVTSSIVYPLLFHLSQWFPLNTPPISHYNIKYHFLYLLFIYYQFFFYY